MLQGAGRAHAAAAMGARGRRLHRAPVRREARLPTLAELNAAAPDTPVFILHLYDRALLNRAALRAVGLHQGHARAAGRHDRARRQRRADRPAAGPAQRADPLRHPGQGSEAAAGVPDQLDPPLHARDEPAGRHRRDRRRRRLPELSRRLRGHRGAASPRASSPCASPTTCSRRSPRQELADFARWAGMVRPGAGRRHLPPQRRRRDAGVLGRRLRGLPRSRGPDMPPVDGGRARAGGPAPGGEPLAVPAARDL